MLKCNSDNLYREQLQTNIPAGGWVQPMLVSVHPAEAALQFRKSELLMPFLPHVP